jgi:hypothetical protein
MVRYRDFLYLDEDRALALAGQAEGGLVEGQRERSSQTVKRSVRGGTGLRFLDFGAERGGDRTSEVEQNRRETVESRYNRLHDHLFELGELTVIDGSSPNVFQRLSERFPFTGGNGPTAGSFIEVALWVDTAVRAGERTAVVGYAEDASMSFTFGLVQRWLRIDHTQLRGRLTLVGSVVVTWEEWVTVVDDLVAEVEVQGPAASVDALAVFR